jgi:hypothetical protein
MAEELTTLPPVAKSIFVFCKKCDSDRYHTVLAHKSESSASVQCEVCKAKSTWKVPKTTAPKEKKLTGAAAKRKEASANARKSAHTNEYTNLAAAAQGDAQSYNMRMKFTVNTKVEHPKFGLGVIKAAFTDKIEVVFADEVRMLVHNRS